MSEENIEKHLSEILENHLRKFFAQSLGEKLDSTAEHFDKIAIGEWGNGEFFQKTTKSFPQLKTVVEKVSSYFNEGYAGMENSQHEEFILRMHDRELKRYFSHKWQEAFFLLTPLFLTTFYLFDSTGKELLSQELREQMLRESGLDTAQKRRDASRKYVVQLLSDGNLIHGGSEGFYWDKEKRAQLLANYNRYYFVIKYAKRDFNRLKKKLSHRQMTEQIQSKYGIPDKYIEHIFKKESSKWRALEWAKSELQNSDSNEHLTNVILRQAKTENQPPELPDNKLRALISFIVEDDKISKHFVDKKNESLTRKLRYIAKKPSW